MKRGQVQPSPFPSSAAAAAAASYDKYDKRNDKNTFGWRKNGMRVLLLAVTAAVMGTLLLEHARLKAMTTPQQQQQILQPKMQQTLAAVNPAAAPTTTHSATHAPHKQQQQQQVAPSSIPQHTQQQQQAVSVPTPSTGAYQDPLPRNRCVRLLGKNCQEQRTMPDATCRNFFMGVEGRGWRNAPALAGKALASLPLELSAHAYTVLWGLGVGR
jgi:hypothetical protein